MSIPSSKPGVKYTYGDYLKWPDEERWELIDGVPYLMSPAPSVDHQSISGEIFRQLANYLLDKNYRVFRAPFDVRIPSGNEKDEDISA